MKRVLIVDDDKENIELLTQYLSREGLIVQSATEGEAALHRLKAWKPHLILLDINLPGLSGLELIPKIRFATQDDYVAIVLVSGNSGVEAVTQGLDAGADDYMTKPFRSQELVTRVRTMLRFKETQDQLKRANHRIEELTSNDDLTGLLNMRALYRKAEEEILRSQRFKKPVSALLINLDGFSAINQAYGFSFGTALLEETGKRIKQCARSIDLVARVGSDEFIVLLIESDLAAAEFTAERIKDVIGSTPFKLDSHSISVTAGIGVAGITYSQDEQKMSDLFHNASEALHSAKANGPGQIEIYSFA